MKTCRAYLALVIVWEVVASSSAPSLPLLCRIIKVVSNGRGPSLLAKVIFAAINLLEWCTVEVSSSHFLSCLLLLSAHALVIAPLVMDRRKHLREEFPEVNGPPSLLLSSLQEQG